MEKVLLLLCPCSFACGLWFLPKWFLNSTIILDIIFERNFNINNNNMPRLGTTVV